MVDESILIVDDNKQLRRLYEQNFAALWPESHVITAASEREVLQQLRRHHCDFIIADCDLPGVNSLELARAVYQQRPEAHILLMTINDAEKVEALAQERHLPIDGCLDKTELLSNLWEYESRKVWG